MCTNAMRLDAVKTIEASKNPVIVAIEHARSAYTLSVNQDLAIVKCLHDYRTVTRRFLVRRWSDHTVVARIHASVHQDRVASGGGPQSARSCAGTADEQACS